MGKALNTKKKLDPFLKLWPCPIAQFPRKLFYWEAYKKCPFDAAQKARGCGRESRNESDPRTQSSNPSPIKAHGDVTDYMYVCMYLTTVTSSIRAIATPLPTKVAALSSTAGGWQPLFDFFVVYQPVLVAQPPPDYEMQN